MAVSPRSAASSSAVKPASSRDSRLAPRSSNVVSDAGCLLTTARCKGMRRLFTRSIRLSRSLRDRRTSRRTISTSPIATAEKILCLAPCARR
jgi:hypothetical protein